MWDYIKSHKVVFIIGGIVLLAIIGFLIWYFYPSSAEGFAVDGAINGAVPVGGLYQNSYNIVKPSIDTFADIVAPSEPYSCPRNPKDLPIAHKAGQHQDYRDLMPDVNTHATAYDIDVTDPEVFIWRPSIRTAIHNRQQETADPYRGDLPITKDSCGYSNNGWFSSRYNEGDARLDAYFSEFSKYKFRALTGQKSYPQAVANEGLIMDNDVKANEMVLDWY